MFRKKDIHVNVTPSKLQERGASDDIVTTLQTGYMAVAKAAGASFDLDLSRLL
jgi:hypothetical protein